MKQILAIILAALAFTFNAPAQGKVKLLPNDATLAASPAQGTKAVAAAGTPVRLVATSRKVESVEIFARKNDTTANTGVILVGFSATAGSNNRVLAPGESFTLSAPAGKKVDLYLIYIDAATTADAVVWSALN